MYERVRLDRLEQGGGFPRSEGPSDGVARGLIRFRVYIHETADVAAAEQFWADVTNSGPDAFYKAVLKRHNPKTVRKNVDADYRGCLRIDVMQSADLYRRIEGWARAAMKIAS